MCVALPAEGTSDAVVIPMRYSIAVLLLAACAGREYYAPGTALAPNADFEVSLENDGEMTIEVDRIARPAEIDPDARRFAVWVERPGAAPALQGFLRYDRDAQSGRMEAVTPPGPFTVIVTAEADERPAAPSNLVVAERAVS